MEGYSVTEAASVLGVPTERVWELLARGVLSGAPEGDTGMRVYLQPRPAPAPPDEARPNGHGAQPEHELSPFRELLTEFRNLTERYGQALLALGEARGEVASLRSRVDLLEARMDLRLPMGEPPATTRWASSPMPMTAERAVVDTAPTEPPPLDPSTGDQAAEPEHADEEHRARPRGPRRATESFAAALARAEDPSVPELPSGPEAGSAVFDLHGEQDEASEAVLPRELPAAETMPVADEPMPEAVVVIADEPTSEAEPPADEAADGAIADQVAAAEPMGDVEPESAVAPLEASPEPVDVAAIEAPVESQEPEAEPQHVVDPAAAVSDSADADAMAGGAARAEPLEWDAERYTTDIEAPDWLEAEAFEPEPVPAPDPEAAALDPGPRFSAFAEPADEVAPPDAADTAADTAEEDAAGAETAETAPPERPEPDTESEPEAAAPAHPAEIPTPVAAEASSPPVDEETILWLGRSPEPRTGADEMEVSAAQTRPSAPATADTASPFPGSQELDEALAALDAIGTTAGAAADVEADEPDEWPPASSGVVGTSEPLSPRRSVEPSPIRPAGPRIGAVRSPATRAYRRLRRIFPA